MKKYIELFCLFLVGFLIIITVRNQSSSSVLGEFDQEITDEEQAANIFSEESLQWLEESKLAVLDVGFPTAVTPFTYYYSSTNMLKGILTDLSSEMKKYGDKYFNVGWISNADFSRDNIEGEMFDLILTGKQSGDDAYYTQAIASFEYSFFVTDRSLAANVEDLEPLTIGIVNNDDTILKHLNNINPDFKVKIFKDYNKLYKASEQKEIEAVFVPKELFSYYNAVYEMVEVPFSNRTNSQWFLRSEDKELVQVIDELLDYMYASGKYNESFNDHENTLYSKLYNFEKRTQEWLMYGNPKLKVGIYDVMGFMTYDAEKNELSGVVDYILDELIQHFGIEFEFIYGTYDSLLKKFESGEIDVLPQFVDNSLAKSDVSISQNSNFFEIYRGELNAYGLVQSKWLDEMDMSSVDLRWGILPGANRMSDVIDRNQENLYKSVVALEEALTEHRVDYLLLDPNALTYIEDQKFVDRGIVGKYTFGLLVQEDEMYQNFFNAVNKQDYSVNRFTDVYENTLATTTYLNELKILQEELVTSQKRIERLALATVLTVIGTGYFILKFVQNRRTEYLKYTDSMTGVLNRLGYDKETNSLIKSQQPFTFIIFDVDKFKQVNDTYGHLVGDEVIIFVASTLKKVLPPSNVICRLGGDEFVLCMSEVDVLNVRAYIDTIMSELAQFKSLEGIAFPVTISSGIVINKEGNSNLDKVYHLADQALYESKKKGRNCYSFSGDIENKGTKVSQ